MKFVHRWKKTGSSGDDKDLRLRHWSGIGSSKDILQRTPDPPPQQSFLFSKARALRDELGGREKTVHAWVEGGKVLFKKGDEAKKVIASIDQLNQLEK